MPIRKMFRRFRSAAAKTHYQKSLLIILLLASLPGIIIGFSMFVVSKSKIERELQEIHQAKLLQAIESMDEQFSDVEMFAAHWAFDSHFNENLLHVNVAEDYERIHEIYQTLLVMEGSNPLVEWVELYVSRPLPVVYTKDGYRELNDPAQITEYNRLLQHDKSLFWSRALTSGQAPTPNSLSSIRLIHKIPGGQRKPFGAFILYLHHDKVIRLAEMLSPYPSGFTVITAEDGKRLFGNVHGQRAHELERAVMEQVLAREVIDGNFLLRWEGQTYSVTTGDVARLGMNWRYISAAPLHTITEPVMVISKLIISANAVILLAALGISWFASKKLYSPIEQLMQKIHLRKETQLSPNSRNEFEWIEQEWKHLTRESQMLQIRVDQQLPLLKEGFLLQLLQGYLYSFTETELRSRMQEYGWDVEGCRFSVIYIQLRGFSRLEGRFSKGDEGLVTFAAANIVAELVRAGGVQGSVVNFHDLSIGMLVCMPRDADAEQSRRRIKDLCHEIVQSVQRFLHLHAIVATSRMTDALKMVPALFEECKLSLNFRNLQDGNQWIEGDASGSEEISFAYPFDLEKEILHAVRLGQAEKAGKSIKQFIAEISRHQASELLLKQCAMQLLGGILHIVFQSGLHPQKVYGAGNLYEQLLHLREPEDMALWLEQRAVNPFIQELSKVVGHQRRRAVEQVIALMHETYMTDISLESCADHVRMNPFLLSKVFKETTGTNFIDYLTQIRLEKAKELLRETDLKMNQVAESVGYQQSYFNRLFKKSEGVTPGRYRELSRMNQING